MADLFTNLAFVSADGAEDRLFFWQKDGTLNGSIVLPGEMFDLGQIAVSVIDDRVYAIFNDPIDSGLKVGAWDHDGNSIAEWSLGDEPGHSGYAIAVADLGKVLVAVEGDVNGEVWELTRDLAGATKIADLTASGVSYLQAYLGMAKKDGFLYFNALVGAGDADDKHGIWKTDLSSPGDATQLVALDFANGFALTHDGDLLVSAPTLPGGDTSPFNKIHHYDNAGAFIKAITAPGVNFLQQCGLVGDGLSVWVVGVSTDPDPTIWPTAWRFRISDGMLLDSAVVYTAGVEADQAIGVPDSLQCCEAPDENTDPILAFVPEIKDTTTHNQALETVATIPVEDDPDAAVTLAPSFGGNVWIVYDVN